MAEKEKESSWYRKSEKGTTLLADLEIEKDFLTSPKSVAEDDQMDIDFCTVAEGNKEPLEFDNMFGKIAKKTNANQDAEPSPSLSGSLGFGTLLKETIGASEGDTTSKFDSQLGGEPNSLSKEKSHTSLTDVHLPSKSDITKDQATNLGATISQKPISGSTQEADQDSCQKERNTLQEPYKETCQNSSLQFVSETSSTYLTAHSSTEEVGCLARKERTKTDGEQSISGEQTDFGFNCGNLRLDKLPVDIKCLQSNDGECSQFSGDNPVGIDNSDDAEPTASKKMVLQTDGETMESSSYQRSEKGTALLADLDIEKDFLTSSKSVAEDDKMDIDFCTVAEGNKEPFEFDNMDKDFRLEDDFGKTSSINVDISDHDISFPVEKDGKPSGMSKEVSAEKKTQEKSDQSTPQFDFNVFGKIAKKTNANQDAEPSPSLSGSLGFGTLLKETIGASEGDATSNFDSQLGGELNSSRKEKLLTSLTDVPLPSKSEIPKDQATYLGATTLQKPISGSTQEADQDSCQKERNTQQEPYKETCQNSSLQFVSETSLTYKTAHSSTEEAGCLARKERTKTDGEQSISGEQTDFGFNCGNLRLDKLPVDPVDIKCLQSNDGECSQFSGDNPVGIDNNDDAEPIASKQTDGETMDAISELAVTPSNTMETIILDDDDGDDPGIDTEDMWCVDPNLEDLIVPRNTSTEKRILLELERRAPRRIKKLSPSEKLLALKATVGKYVISDEEKKRKLLEKDLERSRERISLEFEKKATGIYDVVPGVFFLRPFREALEANTAESMRRVIAVSDGVLILKMMLRAPCRLIAAEVERFSSWCEHNNFHPLPPSNIYERGVVLGYFGLDRMIAQLVENYLQRIINVFFGFVGRIDQHFSFCVEIGADKHHHIANVSPEDRINLLSRPFKDGTLNNNSIRSVTFLSFIKSTKLIFSDNFRTKGIDNNYKRDLHLG